MEQQKKEDGKVTLIGVIPQYPDHSKNNIYGKVRMPPVGIISVLSQIANNPDYNAYIIDENNYAGPSDLAGMPDHEILQKKRPALVAMLYGGMSNSIPRMFSLAQQYKGFGAITIAGGSHVDALPEEALRSGIDIVVHGEGEHTAQEILETVIDHGRLIYDTQRLKKIKGISFLDKDSHVRTAKREPITDLDSLFSPDITMVKFLKKKWSAIPINRGRGCNFSCEFCVVNTQYGRYKSGSTQRALEQVIRYSDLGYKAFFFTDDNFAQDMPEAIDLCRKIGDYKREFNKKIELIVQVRSEVAENDELIAAMRYAGVDMLAIGYESPINEELAAMRKGVTVEKLVKRSRKLSRYFNLHGMFIFGYPGENQKSGKELDEKAKEYWRFFKKARIDTIQVLNAVPLPGSKLRERLEKDNRLLPLEVIGWDKHDGAFLTYKPIEGEDPYELQNIPRMLMKKVYLGNRVSRIVNYGNWMNWAYNASIGFPIMFTTFYTKRFFHNLVRDRKEKAISEEYLGKKNVFSETLSNSMIDIKKQWRNLAIRTYGAGIVRRWTKLYEKSDYHSKLEKLSDKKTY